MIITPHDRTPPAGYYTHLADHPALLSGACGLARSRLPGRAVSLAPVKIRRKTDNTADRSQNLPRDPTLLQGLVPIRLEVRISGNLDLQREIVYLAVIMDLFAGFHRG